MKSTERFKETIKNHLDQKAQNEPLFANKYVSENKNIDDCITYILSTVQKSSCNGFTDDEIFSMAVHYYDEENIDIGKISPNVNVVVNHKVELTKEEKEEAKKKALERAEKEQYDKITGKTKKKQTTIEANQQSLF